MKTPKRLENAVTKLYNAFHEGTLNSFECAHCAVGNICDNNMQWAFARHSVFCNWNYNNEEALQASKKSNYSLYELEQVETIFVNNVDFENRINKEAQFKGLCAVIEYLCELDGVENILEIQSLFEFDENKKPINQLTF